MKLSRTERPALTLTWLLSRPSQNRLFAILSTLSCRLTQGAQGKNIVPDDSVTETTTVPSAAAILDPHYPSFNTGIPDQYRVDYYLPQFKQQVASNTVPNLTIIWLPDDHTSGYTTGFPVPASAQADNDLALDVRLFPERALQPCSGDHGAQPGSERAYRRDGQGQHRDAKDAHAESLAPGIQQGDEGQDQQGGFGR
jgi:hypothetical protein